MNERDFRKSLRIYILEKSFVTYSGDTDYTFELVIKTVWISSFTHA